jgi:hypothetical protein
LQSVFLVAVPFAALAFVLSWLIKEIPLRTTAFNPAGAGPGTTDTATGDTAAPVRPGAEVPAEAVTF